MEGFLLIDKPLEWTSSDVVQYLKKFLPKKTKIGHAGTLDPLATGLILVAITRKATKQLDSLIKEDKRYITEVDLSAYTTTDDREGELDQLDLTDSSLLEKIPTESQIQELINREFLGRIRQKPSKYSAIKINGERAYKLAREGKEVDIPEREITIYDIKILDYDFPILKLDVKCSTGTYIRTLGRDIGTALGFRGYLKSLRRLEIGNYSIENAITIDEIKNKFKGIPEEAIIPV